MNMKIILLFLCLLSCATAQQAPWARSDIPISPHDRVYAANQTSNTVSVIDPYANKLLGVIKLGDPVPGALGALYKGQLLVHGLGYSPDGTTLAVVSIGSNSVALIDTTTNKVNKIIMSAARHTRHSSLQMGVNCGSLSAAKTMSQSLMLCR
jgi:YVTN family beta-propeller protein